MEVFILWKNSIKQGKVFEKQKIRKIHKKGLQKKNHNAIIRLAV